MIALTAAIGQGVGKPLALSFIEEGLGNCNKQEPILRE